jgi:hypothetical protein
VSQDGQESPDDGQEVGSVAEEAARLVGALSDWARDQGTDLGQGFAGVAAHLARTLREVDEHLATGAAECAYCPVCRTVHALRRTSPEVRDHLTSAASSLVQAAAGLLATVVPEERAPRPGVERIDLADDAGDWPEETVPEEDEE